VAEQVELRGVRPRGALLDTLKQRVTIVDTEQKGHQGQKKDEVAYKTKHMKANAVQTRIMVCMKSARINKKILLCEPSLTPAQELRHEELPNQPAKN
jgi:hypothetical protein